jgi:hypothetical protein
MIEGRRLDRLDREATRRAPPTAKAAAPRTDRPPLSHDASNPPAPPPVPGTNIAFIPYTSGTISSDKEADSSPIGKLSGGFDSKIALSSTLNLDLTVNPDFSQIEVDKQVTNLTRFNIFFPEKRTFFLENDDLFSNYGIPPIRPFYSRKEKYI